MIQYISGSLCSINFKHNRSSPCRQSKSDRDVLLCNSIPQLHRLKDNADNITKLQKDYILWYLDVQKGRCS